MTSPLPFLHPPSRRDYLFTAAAGSTPMSQPSSSSTLVHNSPKALIIVLVGVAVLVAGGTFLCRFLAKRRRAQRRAMGLRPEGSDWRGRRAEALDRYLEQEAREAARKVAPRLWESQMCRNGSKGLDGVWGPAKLKEDEGGRLPLAAQLVPSPLPRSAHTGGAHLILSVLILAPSPSSSPPSHTDTPSHEVPTLLRRRTGTLYEAGPDEEDEEGDLPEMDLGCMRVRLEGDLGSIST